MPFPVLSSPHSRISRQAHITAEEGRHDSTAPCVSSGLHEKQLQQEDWRSHYIKLLSQSEKWERSLRRKDSALWYLQEALQERDAALKRQEKLIEETKQRLSFLHKSEKARFEKTEYEISLLRSKAIQQAEIVAAQAKHIRVLNQQHDKREQKFLVYANNVKKKVEKLNVQLQTAEGSLRSREKSITETQRKSRSREAELLQEIQMQDSCLRTLKGQVCRLEMILKHKESCLQEKWDELETSYKERERIRDAYDKLNKNYRSVTCKDARSQIMPEEMINKSRE